VKRQGASFDQETKSRGDQAHAGKICGVAARVPGEQLATDNSRVRANEKVGQHVSFGATLPAILSIDLPGEKKSYPFGMAFSSSRRSLPRKC
jgi:hypothetical protein